MIDYSLLTFRVEPMSVQDIPAVMEIEAVSFATPWSERAYDYELRYNEMARYYVARPQDGDGIDVPGNVATVHQSWRQLFARNRTLTRTRTPLVGYGGFWMMADEAHISTLATHPQWRRRGIAELLLIAMAERAAEVGAFVLTLEVRVSNVGAQALYRKYGFQVVGRRVKYYSDNSEDALIMTTSPITSAQYQRVLQELKAQLLTRLSR